MKVRYKSLFLMLFGILFLSRILVLTDNYIWIINPVHLEMVYLCSCIGIICASNGGRIKILKPNVMLISSVLVLHTVLWGKVYINDNFYDLINSHYKSQIMFVLIILITMYTMYQLEIFEDFIVICFFVITVVLTVQFIFNIAEFDVSNVMNVMNKDQRTRASFGLGHYNTLGSICSCLLILSFILRKKIDIFWIIYSSVLAGAMLMCSASRSSITSLVVFFVVYYIKAIDDIGLSARLLICIKLVSALGIVCLGMWVLLGFDVEYFLIESQRSHIFFHTLPMFFKTDRVLYGLGFASNTSYGEGLTPYTTYWMDNAYVYYLITTGIAGIGMIMLALVILLFSLYRMRNNVMGNCAFSILITLIYGALFEVLIFSSGTIVNYVYLPILLTAVANYKKLDRILLGER